MRMSFALPGHLELAEELRARVQRSPGEPPRHNARKTCDPSGRASSTTCRRSSWPDPSTPPGTARAGGPSRSRPTGTMRRTDSRRIAPDDDTADSPLGTKAALSRPGGAWAAAAMPALGGSLRGLSAPPPKRDRAAAAVAGPRSRSPRGLGSCRASPHAGARRDSPWRCTSRTVRRRRRARGPCAGSRSLAETSHGRAAHQMTLSRFFGR